MKDSFTVTSLISVASFAQAEIRAQLVAYRDGDIDLEGFLAGAVVVLPAHVP